MMMNGMRVIALSVLLLSVVPGIARQDDLPEADRWPLTVDAAVADILSVLSDEDKQTVRETKREDLIGFHHGWGTGIRNDYGLWRGNDALIGSACKKPCHPDDVSMIIIEKVWETLQQEKKSATDEP